MQLGGLAAILGKPIWDQFVAAGNRRVYRRRTVLMNEGDPVHHVAALLEGRVKVTHVDADGNTMLLAVRGPGDVMGDIGALGQDRRTATVTAIDDCAVSILGVAQFLELAMQLEIERDLLTHLSHRISDNNRLRAEVAVHSAHLRVVRALVHLADYAVGQMGRPADQPVDVGLNQAELSQVVMLARPTVTTELARLRTLGLVRTPRGHVVVQDLAGLRARGSAPPGT